MQLTHQADFLRLLIVLLGVRNWTAGHERIETEQEQHVEEEQTNDTDDEDDNHLPPYIQLRPHTEYRL